MKKIKNFFVEFKKFISRGNILDLAIGVIVGSAFSAIVTAFTNKIIMPLINWLLSLGGTGLESAYTFLKKTYDSEGFVDLANSIYIDWGAFITAILNFFIIALTLFIILKVAMSARGFVSKEFKATPTKAERKQLKEMGVDMKSRKAVITATQALREKNKPAPEEPKPTQEELLANILAELKKQNEMVAMGCECEDGCECECQEHCECEETEPKKKETKKSQPKKTEKKTSKK